MKKLSVSICLLALLAVTCTVFRAQGQAGWEPKARGVWVRTVGVPEKVNLLSELSISPKLDAINAMDETRFPIDPAEIRIEVIDGRTYLRFPLEKEEQIYGLGLNFKTVEQRGRILRLHMDHYEGVDNGRNHAPVPFFVSSKGYGALINSARYLDVWVGTGVRQDSKNPPVVRDRNTDKNWSSRPYSDNLEILVPAEGVEVVLFAGKNMLDVVRRFNLYNGGGTLPPRWGLGFWHRVPTRFTDSQVMEEVAEFEKRGFPLGVIGLEPGWMSKAYPCTYMWDSGRFPDPQGFIKAMKAKHIETNLWINPYIWPEGELYEKIKPYTGSHTVWCGVVPDYSMPAAQKIMTDHFGKYQVDLGVSGYKMDENDGRDIWLWPDVATFPSGNPGEKMRSLYGALMQSTTTDMYRARNQRTYGLVRAANAGTSSFPYVIYSDYYNHRDYITALINSSFIGVLWTPEVRSARTSEEWLRRMQTVVFSPLSMLNAWSSGTKPWTFTDVEKEVNNLMRLRMQLIPYLYTAFADYAFYGTPPVRAMNLEEGYDFKSSEVAGTLDDTTNPYAMALKKEAKDQYMFGEYLLVAPLFDAEAERQVVLPKGKWFDFYTGEYVGDGEVITAKPGVERIPVYVKDGGIIPLFPPVTTLDGAKLPVEIRHYGSKPGTYSLYDDDGLTYDYEKGAYIRIAVEVTVDAKGNKKGKVTVPKGGQVWSFKDFSFNYMTKP